MIPVNSSAISHYQYANGLLTVKWKSNSTTTYVGVPDYLWEQLQASESKGKFIATKIKGHFKEL